MCLIVFAYKAHPRYRLIVAANRDESYARPTARADFWEDEPKILAGRDLEKMGTWMGVSTDGRFAALTNYRDPKQMNAAGKRSRGELAADFLKSGMDSGEYMTGLTATGNLYPGYNLLVDDGENLFYFSNMDGVVREVEPGIHGVSNHLLNTPWPKVTRGKRGLEELLERDEGGLEQALFTLLQHAEPAPDADLPDTGIGINWERVLSPLFIRSERYGTRCSTVLLMGENELLYTERVYNGEGFAENGFKLPLKQSRRE